MTRRLVRTGAALIVGLTYFWFLQCAGARFYWTYDLDDYYSLLGRAFAKGQLHLPRQPPPELLALADPWDPAQNERFGMHDTVLFNKRYYLYHGAAPALMLFTPWRLVTGHDLTEMFAAFLFCLGGYLFSSALLLRLLGMLRIEPPAPLLALMLLALGFCQMAPYVLQRVLVYEVAIAAGYFCLSAGFYFFARALMAERAQGIWLALAGLFLGLAAGCRPHLGMGAVFAGSLLAARTRPIRRAAPFLIPVAVCAAALASYNYARFGNPVEFGLRYQLASAAYKNVSLSIRNIAPGLHYLLLAPPEFESVFPFVRLDGGLPFFSSQLPDRYFLEPIAGALATWPLGIAALAMPWWIRRIKHENPARTVLWALYVTSLATVVFVAAAGLSTERFELDFLPGLILISCTMAATAWQRWGAAAIVYSIAVSLAIGIQGPFDDFLRARPEAYVKLARRFGFSAQHRIALNPRMLVEAVFHFPAQADGSQPLISAGRFGARYALSAESMGGGKWRLVSLASRFSGNAASAEVVAEAPANRVRVEFTPANRSLSVQWNGVEVIRQQLEFLMTAPSQIGVGIDHTETGTNKPVFAGPVEVRTKLLGD